MPTPGTVQLVTVASGVPTVGSGTVSTLDNIFDATNGPVAVKAASTAPAAADKAIVVALSPNGVTRAAGASDANTVRVTIDSAQVGALGQTTATGSVSIIPASNPLSAAANGLTSSRVNAAASTNATSLKGSAGNLARIEVFNVAAYDVFFKFYNKASAPTVGTDTPTWTIPLKTGTGFSSTFPIGKSFSAGIAYAITKLQADSDTTVLVAGDVTGTVDWI